MINGWYITCHFCLHFWEQCMLVRASTMKLCWFVSVPEEHRLRGSSSVSRHIQLRWRLSHRMRSCCPPTACRSCTLAFGRCLPTAALNSCISMSLMLSCIRSLTLFLIFWVHHCSPVLSALIYCYLFVHLAALFVYHGFIWSICGLASKAQGDYLSGKPGNVREFGSCQWYY